MRTYTFFKGRLFPGIICSVSEHGFPFVAVGSAPDQAGSVSQRVYLDDAPPSLLRERILYEASVGISSKGESSMETGEWRLSYESTGTTDLSMALVHVSTRGDERFGYGFWSVLAGNPFCLVSGQGVSGKRFLTIVHTSGITTISLGKWYEGLFVLSYKDQLTVFPQSVDGGAFILRILHPKQGLECRRLSEDTSKLSRFNATRRPAS